MTPDDEQIVRTASRLTAPRAAIAQATSYLRSALTSSP
jgi:hypothetical protein